jgi:hypothetical protein
MPNDCYNKVSISGDEKDIAKIKKLLSKGKRETANVFNFANIIEEPDWDKTPNENGGSDEHDDRWYNWRLDNWGTKWNSYDCDLVEEDSDRLEYVFFTAWSPPCPVIDALRNKFPELYISAFYDEPAMELAGYY